MSTRRIGAHLSMAGGLVSAGERMIQMGGNALQIFSGSPRSWGRKPIEQIDGSAYKAFCKEKDFGPTFIHALYLVNLASENPALIQNSINALMYDLQFQEKIGAQGVIVHLGSHLGRGYEAVKNEMIDRLERILTHTPENSTLLIENSAGQDGKIASSFEELQNIFESIEVDEKEKRLGWCLDTCHAFANGYQPAELPSLIKKHALQDSLRVIHLNDSRDPFGSGRDRHDNLGDGLIEKSQLKTLLNDSSMIEFPRILEVPGIDGNGPDAENVRRVKEMIGEKA
ncbi:MAG: putative endonuclease 4 [Microgenomates group bacterium GW2011_GWF2_45_18]|nr:MAG: putative endonuclease 4 [Microgenomates group bacterium GW2011_GWF2_45_18]OGJ41512.1 MAG: hypothetical protein A2378_00515 [Candidatus Pacebacteria bacterium RIFOXYB1_FULL_44_10]HAU98848.1 hypothetical protein [Candidatus Paceibacterota bacterium]HAX01194.1 hypothetical protein [Candidatus Paceibacterota bacterium]